MLNGWWPWSVFQCKGETASHVIWFVCLSVYLPKSILLCSTSGFSPPRDTMYVAVIWVVKAFGSLCLLCFTLHPPPPHFHTSTLAFLIKSKLMLNLISRLVITFPSTPWKMYVMIVNIPSRDPYWTSISHSTFVWIKWQGKKSRPVARLHTLRDNGVSFSFHFAVSYNDNKFIMHTI